MQKENRQNYSRLYLRHLHLIVSTSETKGKWKDTFTTAEGE